MYNNNFQINGADNTNLSLTANNTITINQSLNNYSTSKFNINGSYSSSIKTINSKYYLPTNDDHTLICNCNNNNITILLDNNHTYLGRRYIIKNISSINKVIIKTLLNGNIDGKKTVELNNMECMELQSNGNDWFIISKFIS